MEVSLCVGIADEVDAGSLEAGPPTTKVIGSGGKAGFDVRLVPASRTKAGGDDALATVKPDKLYGLEVWQYDTNGNFKSGKGLSIGDVEIGSSFTVTLDALTDCQLVIIARGKKNSTYTVGSLSGKSLSEVQGTTATASAIEGITASAYETDKSVINAIEHLHLPKVKVVNGYGATRGPKSLFCMISVSFSCRLAGPVDTELEEFPSENQGGVRASLCSNPSLCGQCFLLHFQRIQILPSLSIGSIATSTK